MRLSDSGFRLTTKYGAGRQAFVKSLWLSVCLLFFQYKNLFANEIDFEPDVLCEPTHYDWELRNLKSAHPIDLNLDSVSELLLHIQYNNNARFLLFYSDDCGFREVTDSHGNAISFLSYSSSIACQPIGCLDSTYCEDKNSQRYLVSVVGRHSLSLEEKHRWMDGALSDSEVRSQVTTTRYRIVNGQLIVMESEISSDVFSNIDLFAKRGKDSWGFEIDSCL